MRPKTQGKTEQVTSTGKNIDAAFVVVAEVSQGDQVLLSALKSQPDGALLDIEMPGSDGWSAAQALHKSLPSYRIVILTTFGRSGYLRQAMESGAVGFLLKDAPADQLAIAIRRVMGGERVVDPEKFCGPFMPSCIMQA